MGGTGVIDHFLEIFTRYIDSGFGLLSGEVAFIATTLIVIDVTLAALFWSWGADDDIMARLVKKTLFVGVFAYIIGNWNNLARIIFESFAGLGLKASGLFKAFPPHLLKAECTFPERPVSKSVRDLDRLVGKYRHGAVKVRIVQMTDCHIAPKDAPPAIALQPISWGSQERILHTTKRFSDC